MKNLTLKCLDFELPEESGRIDRGLQAHLRSQTQKETKILNIYAYDGEENIGGILGVIVGKRLNIAALWLEDAYRNQGIGSDLVKMIEGEAFARDCNHALVDTMAFQAPGFYLKQGYKELARLSNVYEHDRIFYKKELA